ncbi:hypothetical protein EVG20_g2413 [Dentipellis fragilis]|uniref:Uncharacterized protein n=1 Tax=Dentipellis fragilis TaxID=205917 RepID=A0A4Y9Z845_9AGAM|nr:hypothetical protein EVG20_g2413 [Dentipellis fragilis]
MSSASKPSLEALMKQHQLDQTTRICCALLTLNKNNSPDCDMARWLAGFGRELEQAKQWKRLADAMDLPSALEANVVVAALLKQWASAQKAHRSSNLAEYAHFFAAREEKARRSGFFDGELGDDRWWEELAAVSQTTHEATHTADAPAPTTGSSTSVPKTAKRKHISPGTDADTEDTEAREDEGGHRGGRRGGNPSSIQRRCRLSRARCHWYHLATPVRNGSGPTKCSMRGVKPTARITRHTSVEEARMVTIHRRPRGRGRKIRRGCPILSMFIRVCTHVWAAVEVPASDEECKESSGGESASDSASESGHEDEDEDEPDVDVDIGSTTVADLDEHLSAPSEEQESNSQAETKSHITAAVDTAISDVAALQETVEELKEEGRELRETVSRLDHTIEWLVCHWPGGDHDPGAEPVQHQQGATSDVRTDEKDDVKESWEMK